MVEVEGNFLTPDHYVARGNGEWSTAGALAHPGAESSPTLAHTVYNIKLQNGGQIELGNRVYAATLGARFDTVDPGKEPMYSEEASRYLHDLAGYASGHIQWALGTASVDCHGMPSPKRRTDPPSIINTATLLDKEILEVILVSQHADQKWIGTLSMMRRVHSTWNHIARSIYPEFTMDTLRAPTQEEKETWRSTFYREKEKAQERICSRRERIDPVFTHTARNVFEILQTYPATLDILVEAMTTLQWRIPQLTTEDKYELEIFAGSAHANTLYSILSRHTLRPTPYAAQDLNSQIQEHIAASPRAVRVLDLGTLIIDTLVKFNHRCPSAIPTLLDSLRILTAGRTPSKKQEKDWKLTNQTAHILSMNLRKLDSTDLIALGGNGLDSLKIFVQTHLISQGSRWIKKRAYAAWSAVQESLTTNLYGIITELLRIQSRQDTVHHTGTLQAIADSIEDITQTDAVTVYGLSILPNLNMGQNSSPLDGVILKVLRSKWDRNFLTPEVWAQGHSQGIIMHSAGASFNPVETARLIDVMRHYAQSSLHDICRLIEKNIADSASFLQTGSTWMRVLAIDNMSNWSRISLLTTELILNTIMAHRQDDPTTFGNCIHTLCLLSSSEETSGRIRDLGGVNKIMKLLPRQFPEKRGEAIPLYTRSLHNSNLRFTLRTLRHLTEPDHDDPHDFRIDTGLPAYQ